MLHIADLLDADKLKELYANINELKDQIEDAAREYKSGTVRILTKQLSNAHENLASALLDEVEKLTGKKTRIVVLMLAREHYELAIDELNKLNLSPRLSLYLDLLHTVDALLTEDNLHAEIHAKKILSIIEEIKQKQLLELPHQHFIFTANNTRLDKFSEKWLPTYSQHAVEALSAGVKRKASVDDSDSDSYEAIQKDRANRAKRRRIEEPTESAPGSLTSSVTKLNMEEPIKPFKPTGGFHQ